ncbi:GPALPP motifs-containing protein 1 [Agrilus planipennis]|uniref:GPALPP motifs-containing protein 1 n=1 Tax=Agrilus planipennis TaxID=224129 RepID=A0A7F5R2W3_AGRPL|nr:GPALPP motifs-containing protein 1 [Agrilus planipennis]
MDKNIIGPALPPGFKRATSEELSSISESTNDSQSEQEPTSEYYGPQLPPHLKQQDNSKSTRENEEENEDSSDGVFGPMPVDHKNSSEVQNALEKRALEIKLGYAQTDNSSITEREEWMTQLPEIGKNLGLGARQFRKNPTADFSDRSSWTDTPKSKEKKKAKVDPFKEVEIQERDKEQGKIAEKFNKKRKKDKSLYEMHQDELKKKAHD